MGLKQLCLSEATLCETNREDIPEGFIDGSVPADKSDRAEENEPEDGKAKVHTVVALRYEGS